MNVGTSIERSALIRRGLRLEYFTLVWNCLEAIVAIVSGLFAGSIALVGFGFDSVIECASGATLLWRLHSDHDPANRERRERLAVRLVGASFVLLATYLAYDAIHTLVRREAPEKSLPGILLAVASLIVMPLLARGKRSVASALSSNAMRADSRQTDLCAYLSAILLGGLIVNALFSWWWADPFAALIMLPIILREGVQGLRGETCCDSSVEDHCCHDEVKQA
ncbi:MAG TPA: cation transporter [Terriglobales bacterium]|nr:cation transporter [Terriglobales bacterium]